MICAAMFLISALCAFYTAALNIELITFFMGGDSVQPEPSGEYRIESSARHSLHFFFALHVILSTCACGYTYYLRLWLYFLLVLVVRKRWSQRHK